MMIDDLKEVAANDLDNFKRFIENNRWKRNPEDFNGYSLQIVEQFGGEDQGSDYWVVFSAEKDLEKRYFQLNGWYASYHGHEYEDYLDFFEVREAEKVIKVWEAV